MLYAAEQARAMADNHPVESIITVDSHHGEARTEADDHADEPRADADDQIDENLNASFGESTISAGSSLYERLCKEFNSFPF